MGHVHHVQRIEVPIEHVFELATKVERIGEWNPYMETRNFSGPIDKVGTTFDSTLKILGRRSDATGTVVEAERPRIIHIKATTLTGEKSDWIYRWEPAGAGTLCTIDVEYELPGGLVGSLVDRLLVERAFERSVAHMAENFAMLAEATVPQPV